MAKCLHCSQKGFFLSTDANGLCKNCAPVVVLDIQSRSRVIDDSMRLAHEGKTFGTRLSRCDLVIEHARALLEYERKEIPTISPTPSTLLDEYSQLRDSIILEEANTAADKSISKADVAASTRSQESALASGLLKIQEITSNLEDSKEAQYLLRRQRELIHRTKLDGFLEAARKAEFKGNAKKAIDQYQEALYFILHDDVSDNEQRQEITDIEAKIAELSGDK